MKGILDNIHNKVLRKFTYKTDAKQYGMAEKWIMPDEAYDGTQEFTGDCEDFALACRKLCRHSDVTNSRLVYCEDETGEGHCVLEVAGWILDNRKTKVMSRDDMRKYKWIAISGYNSGEPWHYISNPK